MKTAQRPCFFCGSVALTLALKQSFAAAAVPYRIPHYRLTLPSVRLSSARRSHITACAKPQLTKRRDRSRSKSTNPTISTSRSETSLQQTKKVALPPLSSGHKENTTNKTSVTIHGLHQKNGNPLGRRDLGKNVVKWISHGMQAMAADFVEAEVQGETEFAELRQQMEPGLTFVIQAQTYLNAIPMPLGSEAICLKACTHYPTLLDHFQRELRDLLQNLESQSVIQNWSEAESWKLLKKLAKSAQHKAVTRKVSQPKLIQGALGMDMEKVRAIQNRIDNFTKCMSELLRIERDAELEFTQEELDAVPNPDHDSDAAPKPIEFLVSHGQAQQELCDTICNLNAISTSTGMLFIFQSHYIFKHCTALVFVGKSYRR